MTVRKQHQGYTEVLIFQDIITQRFWLLRSPGLSFLRVEVTKKRFERLSLKLRYPHITKNAKGEYFCLE